MTKPARPVHGLRPIATLVPSVSRKAFQRCAPGVVQLAEGWRAIVGPVLADATVPRRLIRGTLTIACSGPVAMELQHLSGEVISRICQYLGRDTVRDLRFVQTVERLKPMRPEPRRIEIAEPAAVATLSDGPLRTALAELGRAVVRETASRLGQQPHTRT